MKPPKIIVHDMSEWASRWDPRDESLITDIIVHHTVTAPDAGPEVMDAAEVSKGSLGAGYNYLIPEDGTIYVLRPLSVMPAAAYGRNRQSINIALSGDFTHAQPSAAQQCSFMWLAKTILFGQIPYGPGKFAEKRYNIQHIYGHRDVVKFYPPSESASYATACPGDSFYPIWCRAWVPALERALGRKFSIGSRA